mmetsp:Transcript_39671/g.99901  ORF Transcript_39671/g.99901 Transcript_39671/m.99901 type:complete len:179 (+) Transcript_39671:92-628(+)|eukprot:CAMPEP_0177659802 /NCGR_PEP_ID=MMETSP0447-20121125/17648_1 /TAXON_ID=0 /ORGANISM="Stygamoeba regulata, Strain BSH-02190019" /LENGTH=178 /DNA_ID=CAMNT_0019164719 /DNA_START=30 /DNA_END=566 /DNA_ORIENTATION=-
MKFMKCAVATTTVPSLFELCKGVLISNLHLLGDCGDVPVDFLAQILPYANPKQLARIEDETGRDLQTNNMWKGFCLAEKFWEEKPECPEGMEPSFRDMYTKCMIEREKRLEAAAAAMRAKYSQAKEARGKKQACQIAPRRDPGRKRTPAGKVEVSSKRTSNLMQQSIKDFKNRKFKRR